MTLIDKLGAVNRMLISSGLSPVTNLNSEGSSDSRIAEMVLDDCVLDTQLQGVVTNTYMKTFIPDLITGEVLIPNYISIEPVGLYMTDDGEPPRIITFAQRNGKLFNVDSQSFDFGRFLPDGIRMRVEEPLHFDELTVQMQREVVANASLKYQLNQSGDPQVARLLAAEQDKFRQISRSNDVSRRRTSIFSAPTPAQGAIARERWGSNPNTARYPGF